MKHFPGCYFYFEDFYIARSLLLFTGWGNIFPIFYSVSAINYNCRFPKTTGMIFFLKNFRADKLSWQATIVSSGSKSDEDCFFKPRQIPHFTKILDRLLVTNSVHTKCRGKMAFSFHGEMKYNFCRQLPLRFCALANFSNKRYNYMTAFPPLAPPKQSILGEGRETGQVIF